MKAKYKYIFLIAFFLLLNTFLVYYIITDKKIPVDDKVVGDKILNESEAFKIGKDLFDKAGNIYLNYGNKIEKNSNNKTIYYQKVQDAFIVSKNNSFNGIDGNLPYVKLIIDDVTNIFSKKEFKNFCNELLIIEYDNDYYCLDNSREAVLNYANTELELISISHNKLFFKAFSYYYLNASDAYQKADYHSVETEKRENNFEIILENGNWKVNEFVMPY